MGTHDLFGDRADAYARTRPGYPEALFAHLDGLVRAHDCAWDCGAGGGQASRSLARRFARVVASDTSARQLAFADASERVARVVAAAEAAPLRARSVDLVTASAALHWFDRPRFFAEVARVARPGAIFAAWSYYRAEIDPEVDRLLDHFAEHVVQPYWPPGFEFNRAGYRDVELPFERLEWPVFHAEAHMNLSDLLDYILTWSASQAYERKHGVSPLGILRSRFADAWGDPIAERLVRWPLHGVIARVA